MAAEYTQEENDQYAEGQRREQARREGMGLPNRRGMMVPPRRPPQSQQRQVPPHLGGPVSPPPRLPGYGMARPVRPTSQVAPPIVVAQPITRQLPVNGPSTPHAPAKLSARAMSAVYSSSRFTAGTMPVVGDNLDAARRTIADNVEDMKRMDKADREVPAAEDYKHFIEHQRFTNGAFERAVNAVEREGIAQGVYPSRGDLPRASHDAQREQVAVELLSRGQSSKAGEMFAEAGSLTFDVPGYDERGLALGDSEPGSAMGSPRGSLADRADQAEMAALQSTHLSVRRQPHPEIEGMKMPTGAAARFSELATDDAQPGTDAAEQDSGYDR